MGEPYCGDNRVRAYCRPDVYKGLPNILYRNNGNGTFTDVTREAGVYTTAGKGLGVVFGDYDDDGWMDLFVANDLVPNFLFHNKGRGMFSEVGLLAGVAVASDGKARAGMGTDFGDYDGDGRLDLVVTNFDAGDPQPVPQPRRRAVRRRHVRERARRGHARRLSASARSFSTTTTTANWTSRSPTDTSWTTPTTSAPNATYAQRNLLFHNEGAGGSKEVGRASGPGFALVKVGRALAAGDIDNDGDLDLLVTNNGQTAELLRNDGGNARRRAAGAARGETEQPRRHRRAGAAHGRRQDADARGEGRVELPRTERPAASTSASGGRRRSTASRSAGRAGGSRRCRTSPANAIVTVTEGEGITGAHRVRRTVAG